MTTRVYYDANAELSIVQPRRLAFIGYGNQGAAQAKNLRDSGVREILRACLKIETGTISSSEKRGKIDKELQRIPSCRDDCVRTLGSDYRQQEAVCFSKASFL